MNAPPSDRWKAVRLTWCTTAMLVVLVMGLIGMLRPSSGRPRLDSRHYSPFYWLREQIPSAPTLATPNDFLATVGSGEVILHFDVSWSGEAMLARESVTLLRRELAADPQLEKVVVRRIDCNEQSGPMYVAVNSWAAGLGRREWVVSGWGTLVWMKDGKVVDEEIHGYHPQISSLVARTRRAFGK